MHGGHNAGLNGCVVVQSLSHGSQAVGGTGSSGNDLIFLGQGVVVDVVNNGLEVLAGGSGNNNLLSASLDVSHGFLLGGVETGALQHNVHTDLAPGAVSRVLLGVDLDFFSVHDDGVLSSLYGVLVLTDSAKVRALCSVVLQQVSEHLGAGQIVDGNHLIPLSAEHLAESKPADSAETVNRNFYRHCKNPPFLK